MSPSLPDSGRFPGNPEYNAEGKNSRANVTEFNEDVYVYGTLYADVFGSALSVDNLENLTVGNLTVTGIATFKDDVFIEAELYSEYLTVKQRLNVGVGGSVGR